MIVGLDIGTTNLKAGLFDETGNLVRSVHRPNESRLHPDGIVYYDPDRLWANVSAMIAQLAEDNESGAIRSIGITSMAESGLLVDRATGQVKSAILPWFERCSIRQARLVEDEIDVFEHFRQTGLRPSFKHGLSKLLWLKERHPDALRSSVWLSVSSYIAFRLTGKMAEEYTLAARTYAFRIMDKQWDAALLRHFDMEESLFPPAIPSGEPTGRVTGSVARALGLNAGTTVFQAGHDHVCASLAVGAVHAGDVYNSMGTAETMVGVFPVRTLTEADYACGLSFGLHPVSNRLYWMGGHSYSGGSVEWLRELIGVEQVGYEEVLGWLDGVPAGPSGIVFLPYLAGSGAPLPDSQAKAAFISLTARHGKGDLLRAVLEGNAYQMEAIRRCAESVSGGRIRLMRVVGGGTRNRHWLQLKADVSGIALEVPDIPEAALAGAAITAGVGCGLYASYEEAAAGGTGYGKLVYTPDAKRHKLYSSLYEGQYLKYRDMLRS
ncbi:FGGY-family carbohydrate kinase [Cohnella cellulosilytica]|uniref:L-fuculokinase n=1 Tax=Cohnella cellulosilytica TaxID=986710 RepID=A0ABW2F144_9BACL